MLLWRQSIMGVSVPGTKPTFTNIQNLLQFNGSTANSGLWATALTTRGAASYTTDTPLGSGQAIVFNGSTGLYSDSGPIAGTGAFSLACWIKPVALTGTAYLISQRDAQNTGQFSFYMTTTAIAFLDGNSTTVTGAVATYSVPVGKWTHLAAVRANGVMRIYANGVQIATFNKTAANIITTNGLSIGHDQRDVVSFFNGYMKDVVVANRELSADEVLWMAKSGSYFPTS